jgi:hypothetical protein
MERAANLLVPIETEGFYAVEMKVDTLRKKKRLLLIGDSFCDAWTWPRKIEKCFDAGSEFWYYNREKRNLSGEKTGMLSHKGTREQIREFDTFIILFTALNTEYLDYDFMKDVSSR